MSTPEHNFCPFCGIALPILETLRFCPSCGEGLAHANTMAVEAVSPTSTEARPKAQAPEDAPAAQARLAQDLSELDARVAEATEGKLDGPGMTIPMEGLDRSCPEDTVATEAVARPSKKPAPLVVAASKLKMTQPLTSNTAQNEPVSAETEMMEVLARPETASPEDDLPEEDPASVNPVEEASTEETASEEEASEEEELSATTVQIDQLLKGEAPLSAQGDPKEAQVFDVKINISASYNEDLESGDHIVSTVKDADALKLSSQPTQVLDGVAEDATPEAARTVLMHAETALSRAAPSKTAVVQPLPTSAAPAKPKPAKGNGALWLAAFGMLFLLLLAGGALVLLYLDTMAAKEEARDAVTPQEVGRSADSGSERK